MNMYNVYCDDSEALRANQLYGGQSKMKHSIETHESRQVEVRGSLSKPKKSRYYSAILQWTDPETKEPGRISKSTKQADKMAATRIMIETIEELESDLHRAAPSALLIDFLVYWYQDIIVHDIEKTTYYGYRLNLENHILPYFRPLKLRLKDITTQHISKFFERMASEEYAVERGGKQLSANSVGRFHANLKTAFDFAVSQGWMPVNPACSLKALKKEPYKADFFMDEIVDLWLAVKGTIIEPAVFLTSLYGFRVEKSAEYKNPASILRTG